jgi:hypothetical protein
MYKTIIVPVVLYGCETWSVTLREEHRLRVFENRVLRGIFGQSLYTVLVGKPEAKRPLERPRPRWEDGIRVYLREIGWGCGVDSAGSG